MLMVFLPEQGVLEWIEKAREGDKLIPSKFPGMFINNFRGGSGGLGKVFSSKLAPVDCNTDRKIDRKLLEYGVKFPQKMAANGLRETRKLLINMPVVQAWTKVLGTTW